MLLCSIVSHQCTYAPLCSCILRFLLWEYGISRFRLRSVRDNPRSINRTLCPLFSRDYGTSLTAAGQACFVDSNGGKGSPTYWTDKLLKAEGNSPDVGRGWHLRCGTTIDCEISLYLLLRVTVHYPGALDTVIRFLASTRGYYV